MMIWVLLSLAFTVTGAFAQTPTFEVSLRQAESDAVASSNRLKSYSSERDAATSQASAQFQTLLPRLSLQANYQYFATIPTISFGLTPPIPFGTHSTFAFGPVVNYTLWDSFSGRRTYQAFSVLEKARDEDRHNAELQLLLSLRVAYVEVQLGLEELQLIYDSLELARAQGHDVATRYRAGAAARLDLVTAERSVLNYEIQFKQRQAELSSSLKDLLSLLGEPRVSDLSRPGPVGVPGVTLALKLDSLAHSLTALDQASSLSSPTDDQPQIKSQLLQSEAFELNAESQAAKLLPTVLLSGGVSRNRPNIPNPPSFWQETVALSLSMPLYLGDPTRHLVAQQRKEAEATQYRVSQLRMDFQRDFVKAQNLLESLREQRTLAARDVAQSKEAARLYYLSYQAGKINLIDVQNANVQALQSKVSAARIDAQVLNQITSLKYLSGKELQHDSI